MVGIPIPNLKAIITARFVRSFLGQYKSTLII
jgi:hypothetical protein